MTDDQKPDIALIGCGKMGGAMLHGWLKAGTVGKITILDPAPLPAAIESEAAVTHFTDSTVFAAQATPADIYILAVKPQLMDEVCGAIRQSVPKEALIISIAAGQTIANFEKHFGDDQPVIRVMPNTPAAIGKGISVAVANGHVTDLQKQQASRVLQSVGLVEWVEDEELMNAVTAVSGSGPAYIFLLIEAMAKAGEKAGLPADLATRLARQTVIGSAALADIEHDTPAATLRENVTSPGGTTAAALSVLMDSGEFQAFMNKAVAAATKRGKELSG